MKDLLLKNFHLKLFSLVLAIAVWYYVNITVNPSVVRTFPILLTVMNVPDHMRVEGVPSKIGLKVSGRRLDLLKVFRGHLIPFEMYVEVTDLKEGKHRQKIHYKKLADTDMKVISVNPPELDLMLVKMEKKKLHLEYSLLGSPSGKHVLEEPVITPPNVQVYGPREKLAALLHASVTIDVTGATGDIIKEQRVRLLDKNLEEIKEIVSDPKNILVRVGITPWLKRNVPLEVTVEGEPPRGYQLARVTAIPSELEIEAPPKILKGITSFKLQPVDLAAVTRKTTFPVEIVVPNVEMDILGQRIVDVVVEIDQISVTREIMNRKIVINGPGPVFTVSTKPASLSVILVGPMVLLESLQEEDIFPEAEVPGHEGVFQVIPGWRVPPGIKVMEGAGKTIEVIVISPVDIENEDTDGNPEE